MVCLFFTLYRQIPLHVWSGRCWRKQDKDLTQAPVGFSLVGVGAELGNYGMFFEITE